MNKNKKIGKAIWDLLAKYHSGEANEKEKSALEKWAGQSEENQREFKRAKQLFEKTGLFFQLKKYNPGEAFSKVKLRTKLSGNIQKVQPISAGRKLYMAYLKYAAVILLITGLGITGYLLGTDRLIQPQIQEIASIEKEVLNDIILPDGTLVTLNCNSTLTYPERFSGKTREVEFVGEAFFNVTPDSEHPFIISTGDANIKVLGTSFNVNAYPGAQTVEVVVESGRVQVSNQIDPKPENEVILEPGDKATLIKTEKLLIKEANDDPNFIAWKTHNITFNKSKLGYVLSVIEKTYHANIEVSDPDLNNLLLTAQFNDKPVEFVLDVIRLTFNLELSGENGHYLFERHNQ